MGAELGRWLIALGSVAAWSGIIVAGLGMSELIPSGGLIQIGAIVTILGLIGLVSGVLVYRATMDPDQTVG